MTPRRMSGIGSSDKGKGRAKFSTPFKPGMGPGEPGRTHLEQERRKADAQTQTRMRVAAGGRAQVATSGKGKARKEYKFFDLSECFWCGLA